MSIKTHTAEFILFTDLYGCDEAFHNLFCETAEIADFRWGGNNRTLVTLSRIRDVITDEYSTELQEHLVQHPELHARIFSDDLSPDLYVDLEN